MIKFIFFIYLLSDLTEIPLVVGFITRFYYIQDLIMIIVSGLVASYDCRIFMRKCCDYLY